MNFCCLYDNKLNRDLAKSMIDNHFKVTGEKYILFTDGRKLHVRKESEKKGAIMLKMVEV